MSLAVAIQMDPIDAIDIEADSTFVLALEAQARGHRLVSLSAATALADGGRCGGNRAPPRGAAEERRSLHPRRARDRRSGLHGHRSDAPGPALRHGLHHGHPHPGAHPPRDVRGQRPRPCAERARKALRHPVSRADAADAHHRRARHDRRIPRPAWRHHPQTALRQWRRGRVPRGARGREPQRLDRDVRHVLSRADHRPSLSAGGPGRRQANHPGGRRAGRRREPGAGRR